MATMGSTPERRSVEQQEEALLRPAELAAGVDEQDFHRRAECTTKLPSFLYSN
jgi:hypothetical protein